jgi:hypothetical protein
MCDDGYISNFLNHKLASIQFFRPLAGMHWRQRFLPDASIHFEGHAKGGEYTRDRHQ